MNRKFSAKFIVEKMFYNEMDYKEEEHRTENE